MLIPVVVALVPGLTGLGLGGYAWRKRKQRMSQKPQPAEIVSFPANPQEQATRQVLTQASQQSAGFAAGEPVFRPSVENNSVKVGGAAALAGPPGIPIFSAELPTA